MEREPEAGGELGALEEQAALVASADTALRTGRVPRVVHLIWMQGREAAPPKYAANIAAWGPLNPGWTVRFWDEAQIRALAAERYPEWAHLVDPATVPVLVERADVGRTMILHALGGVYADLDYAPLKPFDPLIERLEADARGRGWPDVAAAAFGGGWGINNCLLVSSPGAAYWSEHLWPAADAWLRNGHKDGLWDVACATVMPTWTTLGFAGPLTYMRLLKEPAARILVIPRRDCNDQRGGFGKHHMHMSWVKWEVVAPRVIVALLVVFVVFLVAMRLGRRRPAA